MNETYDVVVLGSGAAGLTAALVAASKGLTVGLFEKSDKLGGSSAWSGGQVWIPKNSQQADVGVEDSLEEAFTYVMSLSRGILDEDLVKQHLRTGPRVIDYLNEHAGTGFRVVEDYPDYHPQNPGARPGGGRTLEVPLFDFPKLGEWADQITVSPYLPAHAELRETSLGATVPNMPSEEEVARRKAEDQRGMGQALVGRLLHAALGRGVKPFTSHRATELIKEDGRIAGVVFETPDGEFTAFARSGVVLATGGFEWNEELKKTYLRGPLTYPVTPRANEGDGLIMAMKIGAALQNMREAWWAPVAELPEGVNSMNRVMINADRTRPRSIMVNRQGRRFTNEAVSYNAIVGALHQEDVNSFEYVNLPAWLVLDQGYLERYGSIGRQLPDEMPWLTRSDTLEELADTIGVPADELVATVERFNQHVDNRVDADFHRGESAHDRWWGDPYAKGTIEGTLGRIDTGPFYAIKVEAGSLGTKGGPKVDVNSQVVGLDGSPIVGLYAAGNVSSPTGMSYAGAGSTLASCLVSGFLAGEHLAEVSASAK